jgi:molybdopterin-containing oxidoreductase family membrane subunit
VLFPQLFWFKAIRTSIPAMFIISLTTNVGMWFERFVIIATSLHRDFLPSSWGYFVPTWVDILTFLGTFGLFLFLFTLFVRFLPMVAVSEVKGMMAHQEMHRAGHSTAHGPDEHVAVSQMAPVAEGGVHR